MHNHPHRWLLLKMLVLIWLMLYLGVGRAATVPVSVPDPAVPTLQTLCASIQAEIKAKTFTNAECATYLVWVGARVKARQLKREELNEQANTLIVDGITAELQNYDSVFPEPYIVAVCGDGEVDAITGEECDDGNLVDGDGCSNNCLSE